MASFATPVAVTAGTTYVASYFASQGGYAASSGYFSAAGAGTSPVRALSDAAAGGNGVYAYGSTSGFPSSSFNATNYWVDVVMTTTPPADVTPPSCPCSIFSTDAPIGASMGSSAAIEVGVKFVADSSGYITGVRFYKPAGATGTHVGNLWSATGQQLASVTFTGETASGWQVATFATPVAVTAGTTYVASYFASQGGYAASSGYFSSEGAGTSPVRALSDAAAGGNGVYAYLSGSGFPSSSFNATNYWVDVVFTSS